MLQPISLIVPVPHVIIKLATVDYGPPATVVVLHIILDQIVKKIQLASMVVVVIKLLLEMKLPLHV